MDSNIFSQWLSVTFTKFDHHTSDLFIKSQWQRREGVRLWYLCYRWCMVCVAGAVLIISVLLRSPSGLKLKTKWHIYLTNWGILLCFTQALLAGILLTARYHANVRSGQQRAEPKMSNIYWIYWISHTTSVIVAFGISTVYWSILHDPEIDRVDIFSLSSHGLNSVIMFVDLLVVAHPFNFLHFVYPIGFTLIYLAFNYVYFIMGGTDRDGRSYIYTILDWNDPWQCGLVILSGLIFLFCLHCICWFVVLLRRGFSFFLSRRWKHESSDCNDLDFMKDVVSQI